MHGRKARDKLPPSRHAVCKHDATRSRMNSSQVMLKNKFTAIKIGIVLLPGRRDCATRECMIGERYVYRYDAPHLACYVRRRSRSAGTIPRLIQMFARYSRRSDASIGHRLFVRGRQMRIYDDVSALPHLPSSARTRHDGGRIAVLSHGREGGFTRDVIAVRHAVLQTAVNIVYWLPPPISQTLVTRSCRSPTANKPRAVIWRRCLPFLVSRIYLALTNSLHFPSLRQQHVHLGQIEKDLANTRNSKLIRRGD